MPKLKQTKNSISNMSDAQFREVLDLDKIGKVPNLGADIFKAQSELTSAIQAMGELYLRPAKILSSLAESYNCRSLALQSLSQAIAPPIIEVHRLAFPAGELQKSLAQLNRSIVEPIADINNNLKHFGDKVIRIVESWRNLFSNLIGKIMDSFGKLFEPILKSIRPFLDFFSKLRKSNFFLIVKASKGDKLALNQLGRIWWKLMMRHMELERLNGRKPTKTEFYNLVQEVCWEVLKKEEDSTSWFGLAKKVYFSISAKLLVDYAEIYTNKSKTRKLEIGALNEDRGVALSLYKDGTGKLNLFVKTVAQELGVSPQTVRNWIKEGKLDAIKLSYFSRIRRALVPSYLVPYTDSIIRELEDIKNEQESKKLHRIEGYFTISQLTKLFPISRKTLERLDKAGKLVPKRMNNIRYYSTGDVKDLVDQKTSVKNSLIERNLNLAS